MLQILPGIRKSGFRRLQGNLPIALITCRFFALQRNVRGRHAYHQNRRQHQQRYDKGRASLAAVKRRHEHIAPTTISAPHVALPTT